MTPRERLRDRMTSGPILVVPGAYDALGASLIAGAGFDAVYLTGSGVSYSRLAAPDIGLITATEMVAKVWEMAGAVDIPIVADGDNGHGDPPNVQRTVREFERAGAAAIQIEDQNFPKRCGHYAGKSLIPVSGMLDRISAALDARTDENLVLIARTDARAVEGLDRALERANRYAEAGADMIFVEAPTTRDELAAIPAALGVPAMANIVEGGRTPPLAASDLEHLGYRMVIFPNSLTRSYVWTANRLLRTLLDTGTTNSLSDQMVSFPELTRMIGAGSFLTESSASPETDP